MESTEDQIADESQKYFIKKDLENIKNEDKNIDEKRICTVCNGTFTLRYFKTHKASTIHKRAMKQKKQEKRQEHRIKISAPPHQTKIKNIKEIYELRKGTDQPKQNENYQNLLAALLSLRLTFSNEYKNLKISRNNDSWSTFGDIVIETFDQENEIEIEAIQCKQIHRRHTIPIQALGEEKGKYSLKKQLEVLSKLRKRENYENTFFKLFTLSTMKIDKDTSLVYDDYIVENWSVTAKEQWKNRKATIALFKKNHVVNTTDDPDDICIFRLVDQDGKTLSEEEKDLRKFSLFMNQKKSSTLKHLIRIIIEDKFGTGRNITEDIVKFFNAYFNMDETTTFNYKMTKIDVILKISGLLLTPYMLFPDCTVESTDAKLWDGMIQKFDVIIVKNQPAVLNKVYNSINFVLKSKIIGIDTSVKSVKIKRNQVVDRDMKLEIFHGFKGSCLEITLSSLYISLWKLQLSPLVLKVDSEETFSFIIKIINFLHAEDIPLQFILITNKQINSRDFAEHLNVFTSLEDLKKVDDNCLQTILDSVNIPILNFFIRLRDITSHNSDFLAKVTADVFLNMTYQDYSFKDILVPLTDDIIDNTLVVDDDIMLKIKCYLKNNDTLPETKSLSYLVSFNGSPTCVEVPPDI